MGNIQLLEEGKLNIVCQRGFDQQFLDFFDSAQEGDNACGAALVECERVIVEDILESPVFTDPARDALLAAGVRAVQATPLISRSGQALGVFSTHYRTPRRPSERELRLLDVLT